MAEYKNTRRQVGLATKLCVVVPNICGSSAWNCFMSSVWHLQDRRGT